MNQQQYELASDTTNVSPFMDYIDSILKELIEASETIHLEPLSLVECLSSTGALQEFIQRCYSKNTALKLDVLHAVIKIDGELYSDLLRPALLRRLGAS